MYIYIYVNAQVIQAFTTLSLLALLLKCLDIYNMDGKQQDVKQIVKSSKKTLFLTSSTSWQKMFSSFPHIDWQFPL